MNLLEKKMVSVLKDLKDNHNVIGIKAEFEAEGTRMEESLRLKEVITRAGLDLAIKIGGCEAIRDMYESRVVGVNTIIAPMIESPFALKKYLSSIKFVFPQEERQDMKFMINIETVTGYKNFDEMLNLPEIKELTGIVIGRVDLTGSLGLKREDVNSSKIFEIISDLTQKAKSKGLECVVGGGVSAETIPFLKQLPENSIDRYETRKIIFKCPDAFAKGYDKGILKAVGFELMWLKNKRDFYGMIFKEDETRIQMLQNRYDKLIKDAGGEYE